MKIVVTGVDRVLGVNLALTWAERAEVVGLFDDPIELPEIRTLRREKHDRRHLMALLRQESPQWIVHCGPLSAPSWDLPEEVPGAEDEPALVRCLADGARSQGGLTHGAVERRGVCRSANVPRRGFPHRPRANDSAAAPANGRGGRAGGGPRGANPCLRLGPCPRRTRPGAACLASVSRRGRPPIVARSPGHSDPRRRSGRTPLASLSQAAYRTLPHRRRGTDQSSPLRSRTGLGIRFAESFDDGFKRDLPPGGSAWSQPGGDVACVSQDTSRPGASSPHVA